VVLLYVSTPANSDRRRGPGDHRSSPWSSLRWVAPVRSLVRASGHRSCSRKVVPCLPARGRSSARRPGQRAFPPDGWRLAGYRQSA